MARELQALSLAPYVAQNAEKYGMPILLAHARASSTIAFDRATSPR